MELFTFMKVHMPKTRVQKAETIAQLTAAFKRLKAAAFADYQGMTVGKTAALRKRFHAADIEYLVAKKTLLTRAAKDAGYDIDFAGFPGMLGVAFGREDEIAPARLVGEAGKDAPIKLVGGIFEGKVVDQAFIVALSKLPGKQELFAQLLRVMQGPTSAFVRLLDARREQLA